MKGTGIFIIFRFGCKLQINFGTDRSILKDVCPGGAPIKK